MPRRVPDDRRRDGLRLHRLPLHQRVRPGAGASARMVTAHLSIDWLRRLRPPASASGLLVVAAVLAATRSWLHALVGSTRPRRRRTGGPRWRAYSRRQLGDSSGSTHAYRNLVHHSAGLPVGGRADDLWIRGNCQALYLNTGGDDRIPWILVQERDTALDVRTGPDVRARHLSAHAAEPGRRPHRLAARQPGPDGADRARQRRPRLRGAALRPTSRRARSGSAPATSPRSEPPRSARHPAVSSTTCRPRSGTTSRSRS